MKKKNIWKKTPKTFIFIFHLSGYIEMLFPFLFSSPIHIWRIFNALEIDSNDDYVYCGTISGDLMCVQLKGPKNLKFGGPKQKISQGILSVAFSKDGNLIIGGGDGTLSMLKRDTLTVIRYFLMWMK